MVYEHAVENEILLIKIEGDLIGEENGSDLVAIAKEHISEGIIKCMIDISELRYINSTGIGVLITILTKFRNHGGEVCIIKPSESVQKLLIITKLNAIFNIVDTKEQGVKILKDI